MNEKIKLVPWDSKVFDRNVFEIEYEKGFSFEDLVKIDNECKNQNANLSFIKVDSLDIKTVHNLEKLGFNYIEFQFKIEVGLVKTYELAHYKNFYIKGVRKEDRLDIKNICKIAETTFTKDRYSIDPKIGKGLSGKRYKNWVLSSLDDDLYELYKYCFKSNDKIAAFLLVKNEGDKIYLALIGTDSELKGSGIVLSFLIEYLNTCYSKENKNIYTFISAINKDIFNIYNLLGFKIIEQSIVLRKVYES